MRHPLGEIFVTQTFGGNPEIYKKFGLKGHNGLDLRAKTGTDVLAPHSGKVLEAASDPKGYGFYLKIENDKEGSVLAHLKEFKVSVGQEVVEGQVIAISNNTGFSTAAHLHWGYYRLPRDRQNGYAGFIDPTPFFKTEIPSEPVAPVVPTINDDAGRAMVVLERFRVEFQHGNLEGAMNALVGGYKEAQTIRPEVEALKAELRDRDSFIQGQKETIAQLKENQAKLSEALGVENDFPVMMGEITKLVKVEDNLTVALKEKEILQAKLNKLPPKSFWDFLFGK